VKQAIAAAVLLSSVLGLPPGGGGKVFPQEGGAMLDRVLDPLPDLDPFEKPSRSPEFFPDEADKRVRAALIDSLTGTDEALKSQVRFFHNKDAELTKERGTITGLTEHVLDLSHNAIRDRNRYLAAQREALEATSSSNQEQRIQSRLRNDDLTQADALLRKGSANRWGGRLNRLLSSVDLVSIVSGSYIGAAVDSAVSQLFGDGSTDMPFEERKALALYLEHVRRYPEDPENERVHKEIEVLEAKKKQALIGKQVEKAEKATEKGELGEAAFHYEVAALIDPSSDEMKESVKQLRELLRKHEKDQQKGLSLPAHPPGKISDRAGGQETEDLLFALTLRDVDRIEAEAKAATDNFPGAPLAASAKDALAVALELKGKHAEAKQILQEIAKSSTAPAQQKRAEILLKSPEYNLLASFEQARSERRLQTVKYVLLGEDLLKKNLLNATAPLVAGGPAGATSVAAANVIMMGSKLYEVLTSNPISHQSVLDRGVAYIRNHPESQSATEVYAVLAEAYEEIGRYDKAITYYQLAGNAGEEKIAQLKEKAAASFLQAAESRGERRTQELYLKTILDYYPETAAAGKATSRLSTLTKLENRGLRVSRTFLTENPELYGPQGLGLKEALFDGNLNNMELANQGINLLSDQEVLLHFQTPWGIRTRIYSIEKETSERFKIALRKKNYEVAVGDVGLRPKGSPGGIPDLPLRLLRGEPGRNKADEAVEATFSLVRKADASAPESPEVLDSQLLSEKEKPGSNFPLPPMQGSISGSGISMSGSLPAGLWGDRLAFGTDERSPFAGVQLPVPLLQDFIPVDFMLQGRPGRFSLFPKIHTYEDKGDDRELYR
jgi:tetratricopeptide (TPR) repeat protein